VTVVAIHQPPYLPWFGLVDKIARADVFVVLDNVQYNKRAFQHRTLYSTAGGAKYLSLSVASKGTQSEGLRIMDMRLLDPDRPAAHFETLRHRYGRSPGWRRLEEPLAAVLRTPWERLLDLNLALLRLTLGAFAIAPRLVLASDCAVEGVKSELMLALTRAAGGDVYLSGAGAGEYMEPTLFERAQMGLQWQAFVHPAYVQSHGGAFVPGCFALEWLLEAPETAVDGLHAHLRASGAPPPRCLVDRPALIA